MLLVIVVLLLPFPVFAQRTAPPTSTSASSSDVDQNVSLLQGKMSEAIIINSKKLTDDIPGGDKDASGKGSENQRKRQRRLHGRAE